MTDFYTREDSPLDDFSADQCVIIKKKHLKCVSRTQYKDPSYSVPYSIEWYPLCNSYYPYTEDVDAHSRVNHVLGVTPSFTSLRSSILRNEGDLDPYAENHAQLKYLTSNPVSFIILSKPGVKGEDLGKLLSEHWKCVHIHPQELIREEIVSGSRAGTCIEFNLRSGRAVSVDVILKLAEKKLRSKSVQHRGFVISGFPLIPNVLYEEDPVSSESAVFTAYDIFEDVIDATIELGVLPQVFTGEASQDETTRTEDTVKLKREKLNLGSGSANICGGVSIEHDFEEQLNFIFGFLQEPFIIIYITCESSDVVSWRSNNRFDSFSETTFNLLDSGGDKTLYTMYSKDPAVSNVIPEDFLDVAKYTQPRPDFEKMQRLVTLPSEFQINVMAQLEKYHFSALPTIERFVLNHEPQSFIKVDGRVSVARMFNSVKHKLSTLPFIKVVLPQKLLGSDEFEGEAPAMPDFDVYSHTLEECFEYFKTVQTVSPLFNWTLSDWKFKCPVSMKEGTYKDGDPNYAVRFMNKIFFLADEEAWLKFSRNPRPYVLPPFPKPRCKFLVVGPSGSGKTLVSNCLKYLLNGEILNFYEIQDQFNELRKEEYLSMVRSQAVPEAISLLNEERRRKWEEDEQVRLGMVEQWVAEKIKILEESADLLERSRLAYSIDVRRMSSFPVHLTYKVEQDFPVSSELEMGKIGKQVKDILVANGFPADLELCSSLPENRENMLEYLPEELKAKAEIEPATIFDGFVKEYVENAVNEAQFQDIEVTAESVAEMVIEAIQRVERKTLESGGWILENLPLNSEVIERLIPDYIPDDVFVLQDELTQPQSFGGFRSFFSNLSKPDAAWRSPDQAEPSPSQDNSISAEEFRTVWKPLSVLLTEFGVEIIEFNNEDKTLTQLLEEIVATVDNKHRQLAHRLTDEEKLQLLESIHVGEGAEETEDTRRFGDTVDFCPVAFYGHGVLWKGKAEFSSKFQERLYFLSSQEACDLFVNNPYHYLPLKDPPKQFPPLRVCVVGPTGSGKTTLSETLHRNLGLFVFDFKVHKDVLELWFNDPVKDVGFVLEGFPRTESDVEFMVSNFTVPDVILELSLNELDINTRLLNEWDVRRRLVKERNIEKVKFWQAHRSKRFDELMNLKRDARYEEKRKVLDDVQEVDEEEARSEVSYDSVANEADTEEINTLLEVEIPQPELEAEFDTLESYQAHIADTYVGEIENLRLAKETCQAEEIPWFTIDSGVPPPKVLAQALLIVDKYKLRSFEKCYDVPLDLSERLLESGYFFLGRFGRTCPVQIFEAWNPVQETSALQLFPLIHRQFIYFLTGAERRRKFVADPLKYVRQQSSDFPLIPLKLAVIGPPKSGKTTLAERFAKSFGLKRISRGMASRYVMLHQAHSCLSNNMDNVLRQGWELTDEMVVKCAHALALDGRSSAQGFVLDGFPSSTEEMKHLAAVGLVPHLVIDLQATIKRVLEFAASDPGKRNRPPFSSKLIKYRYDQWLLSADEYRDWLENEYQIVAKVEVDRSKWGVWNQAQNLTLAVFSQVKDYYNYAHKETALRLANMQVTPFEFIERQSSFENYCPCCIHFSYYLVNGGDPPDRTGLIQYKSKFYWICNDHIQTFIDNPEQFLPPYNNHIMPSNLPKRVRLPLNFNQCFANGVCVVCYWSSVPKRLTRRGSNAYLVEYRGNVYNFDKLSCMNKFMCEPHKYYNRTFNFEGINLPTLRYRELPLLGMLQHYQARLLCQAISNTATLRPVIAGLDESASAALNIALCLKVKNPYVPRDFRPFYEEAQEKYHEKRLRLMQYLDRMKRQINPYLYYEEPLPKLSENIIKDNSVCRKTRNALTPAECSNAGDGDKGREVSN